MSYYSLLFKKFKVIEISNVKMSKHKRTYFSVIHKITQHNYSRIKIYLLEF